MDSPLETLFSVFFETQNKSITIKALRNAFNRYIKVGKPETYKLFKQDMDGIKKTNGDNIDELHIVMFLYMVAFRASMKTYYTKNELLDKPLWNLTEVYSFGYKNTFMTTPWSYKSDINILNNVDRVDEIINRNRFDFEFKFNENFQDRYKANVKSTWKRVQYKFAKSNSINVIPENEREFLFYIISKLSNATKQIVVENLLTKNETIIYNTISDLQDELYLPIEFTCNLIALLISQRNILIIGGSNGKITSYNYNSNIKYPISLKKDIYSAIVNNSLLLNTETITAMYVYTETNDVGFIWNDHTLYIGTDTGRILYYDFNNTIWVELIDLNNESPIKNIFYRNDLIIFVTLNSIFYINHISKMIYTSNFVCLESVDSVLYDLEISASLYDNIHDLLYIADSYGNIGLFDFNTSNWISYDNNLDNRILNYLSSESVDSINIIKLIESTNRNDFKIINYDLIVGCDSGSVFSYSFQTNVWTYPDGTTNKVGEASNLRISSNIISDSIVSIIYSGSILFIFTKLGHMHSMDFYSGYIKKSDGTDAYINNSGPNHFAQLPFQLNGAILQKTPKENIIICYTTTGELLLYYIDRQSRSLVGDWTNQKNLIRSWSFNAYGVDILDEQTPITTIVYVFIPVTQENFFSEKVFINSEYLDKKFHPTYTRS